MIHKTTRSILSVLLAALLLVTSTPLTPAFADGGQFPRNQRVLRDRSPAAPAQRMIRTRLRPQSS